MKRNQQQQIRRDPDVMWKRLGAEIVTLHRKSNQYHVLNAAASLIFESATGDIDQGEIAARVAKEFGISLQEAIEDVDEAVAGMRKLGLLLKEQNLRGRYEKPKVKEITEKDFSEAVAHGADIACRSMLGA